MLLNFHFFVVQFISSSRFRPKIIYVIYLHHVIRCSVEMFVYRCFNWCILSLNMDALQRIQTNIFRVYFYQSASDRPRLFLVDLFLWWQKYTFVERMMFASDDKFVVCYIQEVTTYISFYWIFAWLLKTQFILTTIYFTLSIKYFNQNVNLKQCSFKNKYFVFFLCIQTHLVFVMLRGLWLTRP